MVKENAARRRFYLLLGISFLMILAFNIATPMMSDDYTYGAEVKQAASVADLVRQEYNQYMTWSGRSVAHFMLRCFLALPWPVFKVANSLMYVALTILIYLNVRRKKCYDTFLLLLVNLALWLGAVDFSQTMLWETGSMNYLWTTTIILGFMTLLRFQTAGFLAGHHTAGAGTALKAVLFFLIGVIAGWCSENTSGGCLLFLLFLVILCVCGGRFGKLTGSSDTERGRAAGLHGRVPVFLITAVVGNAVGLFLMVLAPGNRSRDSLREEMHSGLYGMISRIQKVTLTVGEYFTPLLILLLLTVLIVILQHAKEKPIQLICRMKEQILFSFLFLAVSYALILTKQPQARAWYGAGIFLIIAVLQGIRDNLNEEEGREGYTARLLWYGLAGGLVISFFFTYVSAGANNLRVWRDCRERVAWIEEQKAQGSDEIVVAQLHPDFDNDYTDAYEVDLTEDPGYWTNVAYELYFGVSEITAVPYTDWEVLTGRVSEETEE